MQVKDSTKAFAFVQSLAAEHGMMLSKTTSSSGVLSVIESLLEKVKEEKSSLDSDWQQTRAAATTEIGANGETIAAGNQSLT